MSQTYYIGVDPGTPLSMVMLDSHGAWLAHATGDQMLKDEANCPYKIAAIVKAWQDWVISKKGGLKMIVERVGIRPNENLVHAVPFVGSMYMAKSIAGAYNIPCRTVTPQTWKKRMRLTSNKQASITRARLLFPNKTAFLKRLTKDHDLAEAALLALFAIQHPEEDAETHRASRRKPVQQPCNTGEEE